MGVEIQPKYRPTSRIQGRSQPQSPCPARNAHSMRFMATLDEGSASALRKHGFESQRVTPASHPLHRIDRRQVAPGAFDVHAAAEDEAVRQTHSHVVGLEWLFVV